MVTRLNVLYLKLHTEWDMTMKKSEIEIELERFFPSAQKKRKWQLSMKMKKVDSMLLLREHQISCGLFALTLLIKNPKLPKSAKDLRTNTIMLFNSLLKELSELYVLHTNKSNQCLKIGARSKAI